MKMNAFKMVKQKLEEKGRITGFNKR